MKLLPFLLPAMLVSTVCAEDKALNAKRDIPYTKEAAEPAMARNVSVCGRDWSSRKSLLPCSCSPARD